MSWIHLGFALALAGCGTKSYECSETQPCALGSTCVSGSCVADGCATSDQCGIGQYCDTTSTCVAGCQADTDCKYGEACDTTAGQCVTAECTDTRQCAFNQFCSPTGECYDAGGYYCHDCQTDNDCGGNGNLCLSGYCGVTCVTDSDCPDAYDCAGLTDINGNVVAYQCYTSCWLFGK